MPGVISAFAARKTVLPTTEEQIAPESIIEHSSSVEDDESESEALEDQNSFSVLNSNQIGPSLAAKRVFELSNDAVRIELLKDQSIVILGLCTVWIKSGEISVYGAYLRASSELYRICAPSTHALPQIVALSNADFVLASTGNDLRDLQLQGGHSRLIWEIPGQAILTQRSYHIVSSSNNCLSLRVFIYILAWLFFPI